MMTLLFFSVLQGKQKARHLLCLKLSSAFIKHPAGHLTAFLALLIDLNISPLLFEKKNQKGQRPIVQKQKAILTWCCLQFAATPRYKQRV